MPIILRYVSADGKKTASRVLPKLPSRIRVPEGAKVEVIDTKTDVKMTLAQYVNAHAGQITVDDNGEGQVVIETVASWPAAVAWLDSLPDAGIPAPEDVTSHEPGTPVVDESAGKVMGFERDTLLIGGLVGAGIAAGAVALSGGGGGGPKDTTPPVAPSALKLAAADDTGLSNADGLTSKTTGLTITGVAEAGASVELFEGTASLGTATAGADGTFSLDVDLAAGAHSIKAVATDLAGNASAASTALVIGVDTTAPAAVTDFALATEDDTGTSVNDGVTRLGSGLTFSGKAEPNSRVELFDGQTSLGIAVVNSSGNWTTDVSLTEGTHNVTALARDGAGNEASQVATLTVKVDLTVPAAPTGLDLDASDDNGASNADNITSITSGLTISGTVEPDVLVRLFDGTTLLATVTSGSNGVFVADVDLVLGTHEITARATDYAGNAGPSSATLAIEIVGPTSAALSESVVANDPLGTLDDPAFSGITFG